MVLGEFPDHECPVPHIKWRGYNNTQYITELYDGLESGPAGSSAHRLLLCGKEEKKHKLLDDFVIVF